MRADYNDPFMVQDAMMRGIKKAEENIDAHQWAWTDEELRDARKAVASMKHSHGTLDGVGWLHLDLEFDKARRKLPFWKRRAFDKQEQAWKTELREKLIADAAAIEDLTL